MRQVVKFINRPWPFAVLAAMCLTVALIQDNPVLMLLGYWAAIISFINSENRF